ncbi:3-hydroxyisobutyrate dehydrogenase-like protein [Nocardia nova SH22a]|uniref:3-hydroxyisobutyrate dehydrogenase-like protein n=1 Tax=Nocardia nova SH22a TaxID=1415166 RepID=W5TIM6_9NOCA|nr:NAD(P)-dependent oxidoreductase [Nocardia nova]AHH19004.1 3-hydroxyisobutyrate dehydrogenase-like protein [Nocardia nova SH22a]
MRIGFIGPGRMGLPMVRRLADAGHEVRVAVRRDEVRAAVTESGALAVDSPSAAAEDAQIVLVCLFSDDQVREVCLDGDLPAAMPRGAILAVHTTGDPRTAQHIADRARQHGVRVADVPVSGGPHDIAAGTLTVFVGGDDDTAAELRPALSCYADPILHVGTLGAGQRVKLVNNALFAAQAGLVAAAVDLAAQLGVEETALLSALPHASSSGRVVASIAAKHSVAEFGTAVGDFLRKDIAVVRALTAELGGSLGILDDAISAAPFGR